MPVISFPLEWRKESYRRAFRKRGVTDPVEIERRINSLAQFQPSYEPTEEEQVYRYGWYILCVTTIILWGLALAFWIHMRPWDAESHALGRAPGCGIDLSPPVEDEDRPLSLALPPTELALPASCRHLGRTAPLDGYLTEPSAAP
jgi:hypothetical protein